MKTNCNVYFIKAKNRIPYILGDIQGEFNPSCEVVAINEKEAERKFRRTTSIDYLIAENEIEIEGITFIREYEDNTPKFTPRTAMRAKGKATTK